MGFRTEKQCKFCKTDYKRDVGYKHRDGKCNTNSSTQSISIPTASKSFMDTLSREEMLDALNTGFVKVPIALARKI